MKRKLIPALAVLLSSTIISVMAASVAWFYAKSTINVEDAISGSSFGAYFAYGDGTLTDDPDTEMKEGPYGIETPRHLYNLAWLQYIGYFNKVSNNTIVPSYFELNDDIDMTGWVLPPIGTTTNPFIGEFNGNGHTITGLTVSNSYSEILTTNKIPIKVKNDGESAFTGVNIVGMFGVVGNYNGAITVTYDTSVCSVKDFTISDATIKNSLSNTLIGIAAGYVNGPLENVGIVSSTLNVASASKFGSFANISDYGVIGFCENDYKASLETTQNTAYNVSTSNYHYIEPNEGDDAGWGGSIDMKTMYEGILDVWKTYRTTSDGIPQYYSTRTLEYNKQGEKVTDEYGGLTRIPDVYTWSTGNGYMRYFQAEQTNSSNQVTSSYTFAHRHAQNSNTRTDAYLYLYGDETNTISDGTTVTTTSYTSETATAYTISYTDSDSTVYYLTNNGTNLAATTSADQAGEWFIENRQLFCMINDVRYYVYGTRTGSYNNYTMSISLNTNQSNYDWTRSGNQLYITYEDYYDDYDYYLHCRGGTWAVEQQRSTVTYYYISDGNGNYLTASGSTLSNTTTRADGLIWNYDSTYGYYYVDGNNTYYLRLRRYRRNNGSSWTDSIYLTTTRNETTFGNTRYYIFLNNGNAIRANVGGTYYYLRYNNGWTYATGTSYNLTVGSQTITYSYNLTFSSKQVTRYTKQTTTSYEDATYTTKPTYFPLRQNETNGIPNGTPKDSNTGYVVSGGNDSTGDIRVSEYASSKLTNGLNRIYTYNDGGTVRIDNITRNYQRYDDTVAGLQAVFDEDTAHIYGLHFVGATVSYAAGGGSSVYAESATVNGTTYSNYELPRDCIDFNLREKGYINFMAGTYFSGSDDCFFSVHDIFRDSAGAITNIKEIVEVYASDSETNSYVYKYSDGKYSVAWKYKDGQKVLVSNEATAYVEGSITNSLESSYNTTPVFKTSWIKQHTLTQNVAYYFEIPMNPGEYCLSSVANTKGAYLMYLDIGANAQKIFRGEMIEYFKFVTETYTYPKGVGIILAAGNAVSDQNSYCVRLTDSYNGTLKMEKVTNGDVEEGKYTGTGDATKEALSYKFPNSVVKDENGAAKTAAPTSTTTKEIKRLTYFDYNGASDSITKIVVTDTIVNGQTTRTVEKYKNFNLTTNTGTADSTIKIFYVSGVDTIDVTNSTNSIVFNTNGNTKDLLVFNYYRPDGSTITVTFMLTAAKTVNNDGDTIFNPTGYTITITLTNGSGQSTDITADCYVTKVQNSDGTYTYTFTINGKTASTDASANPIVITVATGS